MARRLALPVAALLSLAACGGSSSGGSGGSTLTATGAVALAANQFTSIQQSTTCTVVGQSVGVALAVIGASDQSGLCGYLQRGQDKQNAKVITVFLLNVNPLGATASVTTGTYTISATPGSSTQSAAVIVSQNDAACTPTDVEATGGTVAVTSVNAGAIKGTVDATLSNGGKVTGSFDAPACAYTVPGDICSGSVSPPTGTCVP